MLNTSNGKYWYFRFTKDFFRDKAIRDLKYIPVVGYQYICIYLQMCCLCLDDGSYILKIPKLTVGDSYITYIANEIGEEPKIVQQAFGYFVSKGFIEVVEDIDSFLLSFENMYNHMGRSSKEADRIRAIERKKIEKLEQGYLEDSAYKKDKGLNEPKRYLEKLKDI